MVDEELKVIEKKVPWRLTQGIIENSEANNWVEAKKEWSFTHATFARLEDKEVCLCGHTPIVELCHLSNEHNRNEVIVGNVCVTKFMDIETPINKILPSLLRIKEKLSRSINSEVLDIAVDKNLINNWELNFYWDTIRKRKLTLKQENIRKKINKKILNGLVE